MTLEIVSLVVASVAGVAVITLVTRVAVGWIGLDSIRARPCSATGSLSVTAPQRLNIERMSRTASMYWSPSHLFIDGVDHRLDYVTIPRGRLPLEATKALRLGLLFANSKIRTEPSKPAGPRIRHFYA